MAFYFQVVLLFGTIRAVIPHLNAKWIEIIGTFKNYLQYCNHLPTLWHNPPVLSGFLHMTVWISWNETQ